jgi:hypothetical protein
MYAWSAQWWAWWADINPEWRVQTEGKRLEKGGVGEWTKLDIGGPNGLLNVLMCLRWWRNAMPETHMADWVDAIEDVHWALVSMG